MWHVFLLRREVEVVGGRGEQSSLTNNHVVEVHSLLEDRVQSDLAQLRPHCGLGKLDNSILSIFNSVRGLQCGTAREKILH